MGSGQQPGPMRNEYPPADAAVKSLHQQLFEAQKELNDGNATGNAKQISDAQKKLLDISNELVRKSGPLDRADAQDVSDLVRALARAKQQSDAVGDQGRGPVKEPGKAAVDRSRAKEIGDALEGLKNKGYKDEWPHDQGGQPCWCGAYGMHGGQSR
jgi:hypothetical protein